MHGRMRKVFRPVGMLLVALMVVSLLLPAARVEAAVSTTSNLADKAVNFLYNDYLANGVKNADNGVGSYAVYVLKLAGVNTGAWVREGTALKDAVINIITQDLAASSDKSAKVLAQDLLAAQKLGRDDLADQLLQVLKTRQTASGFDNDIYSDMAAYDLLGRSGHLSVVNATYAKDYILSTQNTVVGDAYGAWGGSWGPDFMATAQAVRALAYLDPDKSDEEIQAAVKNGLSWMKSQQQPDGSFKAGWDDPLIDTAEVIATLKVLNIEPASWTSEAGKSPVDYMEEEALNEDGSFGGYGNVMDAVWALYSYHLLGIKVETQISVTPSSATLTEGEKIQFTAEMQDGGGTYDVTQEAVWSAADSNVASIEQGLATALRAGQTVVRAVYNGFTASAVLTVTAPAGGDETPATCTAGVAVVGMNEELLYGPGYVTVSEHNKWGLTALGTLDATGLPYTMSSKWEGFVEAICGLANSGTSGWMYAVNGSIPTVAADKYAISDWDKVIWYYSVSWDQQPPAWDDLTARASSADEDRDSGVLSDVENTISDLDSGKIDIREAIENLDKVLDNLEETELTSELKEKLAEAAHKAAQALEKLPGEALKMQAEDEKVHIRIDENILKNHIDAIEKAADLAGKLEKIGVSGTDRLVQETVVIELPSDTAGKDIAVALAAGAAGAVTESTLNLLIKGQEVAFNLPPEAVNTVLETADDISQIEIAAQKVDMARVNILQGAAVIGDKVLDLNIAAVTQEGRKETPKGDFPKKITVTISLAGIDISQIDPDKLAVYRQKQDGSWEYVGGTLSPDGNAVFFETERLSVYALMEYQKTFEDIKGHWAQKTIELMAMRLVARGVGENTFAPDQNLTRAQFAAFLVRALGIDEQSLQEPAFRDVAAGYWACGAIEAARKAGLVFGTGAGKFEPEKNITREEMAVMIVRALKRNGIDVSTTEAQKKEIFARYADSAGISGWAEEAVVTCINKGIIEGRTATTIDPLSNATRAETVVVLARLLQCLEKR